MTEKISDYRNNCVLVALKEVSGKDDADILRGVRQFGYRNNKGMYQSDYHRAAHVIGIQLGKPIYSYDLKLHQGTMEAKAATLTDVVKKFDKGVFIVTTSGHAFVLRNGVLVDRNFTRRPAL